MYREYAIKICSAFSALSLMTACSTTRLNAYDDDCGPWLFALPKRFSNDIRVESPSQSAKKNYCANNYHAELKSKNSPEPAPLEKNENKLTQENQFSLAGVQFHLDENWQQVASPLSAYPYFFINKENQSAVVLAAFELNPLLIWSENRDALYTRFTFELRQQKLGHFSESDINGLKLNTIDFLGIDSKYDIPLAYLGTFFINENKTYYVTFWTYQDRLAANKADFFQILNSLQPLRERSQIKVRASGSQK